MDPIKNRWTENCDKETQIYCKSFNRFQEKLIAFETDGAAMSDLDLSSLGLYLCKCVEQEINSTIVQLIREFIGIEMPRYYCRRDSSLPRSQSFIDTGRNGVSHRVYFNDYRDVFNHNILKTIPLGESLEAFKAIQEDDPDCFCDYPVLGDIKFIETWRYISRLRNEMAHAGTVCKYERIAECYSYFRSFLTDYMPSLAKIKDVLAPVGWVEEQIVIDVEPAVAKPERIKAILERFKNKDGKPKADSEKFKFFQSLQEECHKADDANEAKYLALMSDYMNQFDWTDIPFEENGKVGLKDIMGEIAVPAEYDDFLFTQDYILDPFSVSVAKKGEYYGLVKRYSGVKLTEFKYDLIYPPEWQLHHFFFKIGGSQSLGILSEDGQEVVPCIIDRYHTDFLSGMIFRSGDKYGFYSYAYKLFVPPIYDDIIFDDFNKPFIFVLNGVEGCITYEGRFYTREHLEKQEEDDSLEYIEMLDLLMEEAD